MSTLRLTIRGLARTPLFTLVAIFSLAMGIGANTAIFSLLDQFLLRTLPVSNAHELVYIYHPGPTQGSTSTDERDGPSFSYPAYLEMRREVEKGNTPFTGLAGARNYAASLAYRNQAAHGSVRMVSGNYFDVLGVKPAMGRVLTSDDDRTPGAHPVVVLGHTYWTARFGNDPGVLNQQIIVNGFPMTIIGVAQKGFGSERAGSVPDVFAPVTMRKELTDWSSWSERKDYWFTLVARRKPGVSLEQATAAMNVIYKPQLEQDLALLRQPRPDTLKQFQAKKILLKPGEYGRGGLRQQTQEPLITLGAMTLLVLMIACANVANLQLARSAARTREIAVRLAIGASRGQLIRQLLGESCLLAVTGGVLGLAVAYWTLRGIIATIPTSALGPNFLSASLDLRVLLFSLALSIFTGMIFGLFPALQASKPNLVDSLKDQAGQTTGSGAANLFRKTLVTAQVAISLLLLIGAGLFGQTLINLSRIDLGIRTDHLLTFTLQPKLSGYADARTLQFYEQLIERLRAVPGVLLATGARVPAIAGSNSSRNITVEGYTPDSDNATNSSYNNVGVDYFRTMGIPLIAGREFTASDNASAPKVVVVNEAFVRHFLPNQNPLGRRMAMGGGNNIKFDVEIVGVIKDAKYSDMKQAPVRVFYTPLLQETRFGGSVFFYVRTGLEPEKMAPLVRREIAALDANLPIRELKTMQDQLDQNMFAERIMSSLTSIFAGLATILAAIGLYGVLAFNVARRTREFGIRIAIGADRGHVGALVGRELAVMLVIGLAIGAGAAAGLGRFVQGVLFELKPWDPWIYSAAAIFLAIVAIAAAFVPARRATRIDPMIALRYE